MKCQFCGMVFTSDNRTTTENAYVLHIMKNHKNEEV